jgi:hypothetical protein
MATVQDKEIAILCIRNLNRYLEGEIPKNEWEDNLRRIQEMLGKQQAFSFVSDKQRNGPHPIESTSDN